MTQFRPFPASAAVPASPAAASHGLLLVHPTIACCSIRNHIKDKYVPPEHAVNCTAIRGHETIVKHEIRLQI